MTGLGNTGRCAERGDAPFPGVVVVVALFVLTSSVAAGQQASASLTRIPAADVVVQGHGEPRPDLHAPALGYALDHGHQPHPCSVGHGDRQIGGHRAVAAARCGVGQGGAVVCRVQVPLRRHGHHLRRVPIRRRERQTRHVQRQVCARRPAYRHRHVRGGQRGELHRIAGGTRLGHIQGSLGEHQRRRLRGDNQGGERHQSQGQAAPQDADARLRPHVAGRRARARCWIVGTVVRRARKHGSSPFSFRAATPRPMFSRSSAANSPRFVPSPGVSRASPLRARHHLYPCYFVNDVWQETRVKRI